MKGVQFEYFTEYGFHLHLNSYVKNVIIIENLIDIRHLISPQYQWHHKVYLNFIDHFTLSQVGTHPDMTFDIARM